MPFRQQVIVAVPDVNESRRLSSWLEAEGYETVQRSTAKAVSHEITAQPFDLLIVDSAFVLTGGVRGYGLARFRETPVIILGDAAGGRACAPMGPQIMFLERPVDRATFICTVTMALMDRRAERRSPRRSVVKPLEVTVNGVPSQLLDVSKEGVRLELPRERLVTPRFVLRVPVIGVGVAVQRVWVRMPRNDERLDLMWCGGRLSQNSSTAEQGWYGFVENLTSESASASPGR